MNQTKKLLFTVAIAFLMLALPLQAKAASNTDGYEPNNSWSTATAYSSIPVIKDAVEDINSIYYLGFKAASLTNAQDVDWYRANFNMGQRLFADIKNFGSADYNFDIYYPDSNGNIDWNNPWTSVGKFDGIEEKHCTFTAPRSGTYYMKVYTSGNVSSSYYFFYFGQKNNVNFRITNLQLPGVNVNGSSYSSRSINLRPYFPKSAKVYTLFIDDTITGGTPMRVDKRVRTANGNYYYSEYGNNMDSMYQVSLYQTMQFSGKTVYGYNFFWSPKLNGRFTCDMEPNW